MEIKATFIYESKSILILSSEQEEISKMFQKFISKINPNSNIDEYSFFYEGNRLDHNSKIEQNEFISGKKEIIIIAKKKLNIIKCPKCDCNDCIIDLNNYILSFYGCKNRHTFWTNYDKYLSTQKYELSENKCGIPSCQNNQKNIILDLNLCLTCSKLLNQTKTVCQFCNSVHDKDHIKVKYEYKHYYCREHFHKFINYCFDCKKNLCEECVNEHNTKHQCKSYESLSPTIKQLNELKESLRTIEKNISTLKIIIDDITYRLNGALRIYQNYSNIAKDVIEKYELFNKDYKNFTILESIKNLKFSNIKIIEDLNTLIKEENIEKKINSIIKLHKEKYENYLKDDLNDITFKNEKDDDRLKKNLKKERKKNWKAN